MLRRRVNKTLVFHSLRRLKLQYFHAFYLNKKKNHIMHFGRVAWGGSGVDRLQIFSKIYGKIHFAPEDMDKIRLHPMLTCTKFLPVPFASWSHLLLFYTVTWLPQVLHISFLGLGMGNAVGKKRWPQQNSTYVSYLVQADKLCTSTLGCSSYSHFLDVLGSRIFIITLYAVGQRLLEGWEYLDG